MSQQWPLPVLSLFTGYGGFELALERSGIGVTRWQAEIDAYMREIEARHWPNARRFHDVREVSGATDGASDVRGGILCGGFPCQPVSGAGKRLAQADPRWLWPEFARIASELAPSLIFVENVPGLRTAGLRDVLADLASLGFDAEWHHFRAFDIGAPHLRDRFWLVATHPDRVRVHQQPGWLGRACRARQAVIEDPRASSAVGVGSVNADSLRRLEQARELAHQRGWSKRCGWSLDPAPRVDDGPTDGLARGGRERARKAAGNGIVIACAQVVAEATREAVTLL